jgi:hypothetical protein
VKNDVPYYFWAFFPKGDLTGTFSVTSFVNIHYNAVLLDEKITLI